MAAVLMSGATLVATNFENVESVDASRNALSAEPSIPLTSDFHFTIKNGRILSLVILWPERIILWQRTSGVELGILSCRRDKIFHHFGFRFLTPDRDDGNCGQRGL